MEEKRDDSGEIYGWTCDCCGNQIQISLETCRDCSAWSPKARREAKEKSKDRWLCGSCWDHNPLVKNRCQHGKCKGKRPQWANDIVDGVNRKVRAMIRSRLRCIISVKPRPTEETKLRVVRKIVRAEIIRD